MSRSLENKVAIVTGGASGIGEALGEELAARGAEVVLADRQVDRARAVATRISDRGARATAVDLDVRDLDAFEQIVHDVRKRAGHVDYLFNNAGIGVAGEIELYEPADWDDVFDVNLRGVANGIHAVYPTMIEQRSGHIVNTASMAGLVATAGEASYAATKHAVVGLTKVLRIEAKKHGVWASVLCPGVIRTPILTGGRFGRTRIEGVDETALLKMWERLRPMPPNVFAKKTLDRVERNDAIIIVPGWWKAFWYLDRISPALSMRLWGAMLNRIRADLEAAGGKSPAPRRPIDRSRQAVN